MKPGTLVRLAKWRADVDGGTAPLWDNRIGSSAGRSVLWLNSSSLGIVLATADIPHELGQQLLVLVGTTFGWQREGLFDEAG